MSFSSYQKEAFYFKSRPEAFLYLISWLTLLQNDAKYSYSKDKIIKVKRAAKIAFENHEQDLSRFYQEHLRGLYYNLVLEDHAKFVEITNTFKNFKDIQTPREKFENVLGRRSESELFTSLLLKPTSAMMKSVARISQEITRELELVENEYPDLMQGFYVALANDFKNVQVFCGGLKQIWSLSDVTSILKENKNLVQIMFIHYTFALYLFRELPVKFPSKRDPTGELERIIKKEMKLTPLDFFRNQITKTDDEGTKWRSFISDTYLYNSPLCAERGRKGERKTQKTNQLGLMLLEQKPFAKTLPCLEGVFWEPDCINQAPNFNSPAVTDLINNDAVYIAGFSGMCTLLINLMEVYANFENEQLKKNYLTAIAAYIVGAGFHSLHEVLGPAVYGLKLIKRYQVSIPKRDHQADPPNYYTFYLQQSLVDEEFLKHRKIAWNNLLQFFNKIYLPQTNNLSPLNQIANKDTLNFIKFKEYLINRSNNCITEMELKLKNETGISKLVNINLIRSLKATLKIAKKIDFKTDTDIEELSNTIKNAKYEYNKLEHKLSNKRRGKPYDWQSTLEILEAAIKSFTENPDIFFDSSISILKKI